MVFAHQLLSYQLWTAPRQEPGQGGRTRILHALSSISTQPQMSDPKMHSLFFVCGWQDHTLSVFCCPLTLLNVAAKNFKMQLFAFEEFCK